MESRTKLRRHHKNCCRKWVKAIFIAQVRLITLLDKKTPSEFCKNYRGVFSKIISEKYIYIFFSQTRANFFLGDGTIPFVSLSYPQRAWSSIPHLRTIELPQCEHRDVISTEIFFKQLVQSICRKNLSKRTNVSPNLASSTPISPKSAKGTAFSPTMMRSGRMGFSGTNSSPDSRSPRSSADASCRKFDQHLASSKIEESTSASKRRSKSDARMLGSKKGKKEDALPVVTEPAVPIKLGVSNKMELAEGHTPYYPVLVFPGE